MRTSIHLGLRLGTFVFFQQVYAQDSARPNILVILADDAGYHDFGFQGDPLYQAATPNIDTIAHDGVRFAEAYVSCNVCAPSRAGLMTGRYQQHFGFEGNDSVKGWNQEKEARFGLDADQKTLADHLKAQGYYTGIVGKWHLGYLDQYAPNQRGFDFFYGLRGGSRSYFPMSAYETATNDEKYKLLEKNGVRQPENQIQHVTETFGDAALEFLGEACGTKKPFFLYLAFTAAHAPLQPDEQSFEKAKALFPDVPEKRQKYMGLIIGMDRQVGRVLEFLKQKGLDQNTLVVFLSDNGGCAKNASDNTPLRGHKWTPFEGGYRVPMAMKWPGVIKPGSVVKEPVISLDLLPTFIAAAGGAIPAGLDGIDLQPLLGGAVGTLGQRIFYWRDSNSEGRTATVVSYPWKLILPIGAGKWKKTHEPAGPWLFNLEKDLSESTNLAVQYPEIVKDLTTRVQAWSATLEEPRW